MSNETVKLGGRIHGHMTLSKTKSLAQAVKDKILEAPDGTVKVLRKVLIDPETNKEVVFRGKIRISDKGKGNLTAFVNVLVEDVECLLESAVVEQSQTAKPKFDAGAAAKKLLDVSV